MQADTDSSETDTEELVREEIARRKKARLEKAASAAKETRANGNVGEEERVNDVEGLETKLPGKAVTFMIQADDTAGTETTSSQQVSHEELYSPQQSIMTTSPQRTMKIVPSR